MYIKQISVFIENKTGELAEITKFLADKNVNLRALSIADTQDFGILRIICDNSLKVSELLKDEGYIVKITNVLAVEMCDKPGSLAKILGILAKNGIVVEYTYAFLTTKVNTAYMIFRVDDNETAAKLLKDSGINVACMSDLF